ncbi:MAG: AAA family ATPase [Clostridiales bacterium]|nr:AAA family ATPase [Clostridiales bacterium]
MKKRIPIGISEFKEIIEGEYYYIDKSLLIKEIIEDGSKVILLPRPRRFGKTLNMTMLRYFFDIEEAGTSALFQALKVWEHEEIRKLQGKFPVIYLTFKDVKFNSWELCLGSFKGIISYLYTRKDYLLAGDTLKDNERNIFEDIEWRRTDASMLGDSIRNLCEYLYRFHGQKVVILIDEYDTPIYSAWTGGYYNELISFIRNLLGSGLKDNPYIEKAVLTGIMRIAKESIFSGLNNLKVSTLIREDYSDKFGFTEGETSALLEEMGIEHRMEEVRKWYNGYRFGSTIIYNPWSILNYADSWKEGCRPHWVNTGSNDLIRDMLTHAGSQVKLDLECLVKGGELVKAIREDTVLMEIEDSPESFWSFLLFSGYLKAIDTWMEGKKTMCRLKIPNNEVEYVFEEIIIHWARKGIEGNDYQYMLKSLIQGDIGTFGQIFSEQVERSFSYFDVGGKEPEKFYHAFVLGMMVSLAGEYEVKSNRESGYGRYDIMLVPVDREKKGIVIEFKKVNEYKGETLEEACMAALEQIRGKAYGSELSALGFKNILELGIAFQGKKVLVREK